jgi:predicted DNA-binding protein
MSLDEQTKIRLSLDVSPELFATIDGLAKSTHSTKAAVLRKAIELIRIATEAKHHGQAMGIVDKKNKRLVREIVGV